MTENPHNPKLPYYEAEPLGLSDFDSVSDKYVTRIHLPCDPSVLFEILEDAESWTKWVLGIARVEWTSEKPFGVGTTRTVFFTGGMEVYEDFTVWESGKEMAFTFTGITQPVWHRFGEHYEVEDEGDGTCTLTWTVAYEPRGAFAKMHFMIRPMMGMGFRMYMRRLKRYVKTWQKQAAAEGSPPVRSPAG